MKISEVVTEKEFNSFKEMNYDQFCLVLSKVANYCIEESLKNLPHVITSLTNQAAYLKSLSEEFYERNKDLAAHKDLVAKTIERVEANNPGMDFKEVLSIAAPRIRQTLSMIGQDKK